MKSLQILTLFSFLLVFNNGQKVDYAKIQALNASCPPLDTCSENRKLSEDNLLIYRCECKPSCVKYGTCCVDSPYSQQSAETKVSSEETCEYFPYALFQFFKKSSCNNNGKYDERTKTLCENKTYSLEDPMTVVPVTNPTTSTTYKNYYCALCNDDVHGIVFWDIHMGRPLNPFIETKYEDDEIFEKLMYDTVIDRWGILTDLGGMKDKFPPSMIRVVNGEEKLFEAFYTYFYYPPYLSDVITPCVPNVVSDCHPNWKDEVVKHKCHSYMGMIYSQTNTSEGIAKEQQFHNVHCAICNYAGNLSAMPCFPESGAGTGFGGPMGPFSWTWLFDVNPADGNQVGKIEGCKAGDSFDPFFKKCRKIVCIEPGYVVKNGKCEPSIRND